MDIYSLRGVDPSLLNHLQRNTGTSVKANGNNDLFATLLDSAVKNISDTNSYISDAENEKIRFALGETENSHDLTIAMQKASTALQYTIAIRDKLIESYNKIMQMQI